MLELIILTDVPIERNSCSTLLKEKFNNLILLNDDDETLYMKKSKRGFELWFSPNDILDDPICMMDDTIEKCPNKKAYLTNLKYTSKNIAKEIIGILLPHYGNMWIQSDEIDDWFGTAEDFINIYCK